MTVRYETALQGDTFATIGKRLGVDPTLLAARNNYARTTGVRAGFLVAYLDTDVAAGGGGGTTPPISFARPFSSFSPFNVAIPSNAVWTPDAQHRLSLPWYVDKVAAGAVGQVAKASDPVWTFNMPEYIAPDYHRNRPAWKGPVSAPASLFAGADIDKVMSVEQPDGSYFEVWQAVIDPVKRTVTSRAPDGKVGWATGNVVTGAGGGTLSNNDGVRAANFSWRAGLITLADLDAGVIDHALVVALDGTRLASSNSYVAPATAGETTGNGTIPMGTRFGIPPGVAQPAGMSPVGVIMFKAMQKYGAFVGDYTGGTPQFYTQPNTGTMTDPLVDNWTKPKSDFEIMSSYFQFCA